MCEKHPFFYEKRDRFLNIFESLPLIHLIELGKQETSVARHAESGGGSPPERR